ncbi:MAG: hypothetical protein ACR2M0_07970 [Chloroflexia bacterium]
MNTPTLVIFGIVLLFLIFRRARSLIIRQKVRPTWLGVRLGIFAVLGALVLLFAMTDSLLLAGAGAGLAVGIGVAWVGWRLTIFEQMPDGLYYTPNKYVGLGVFAVFLIRLIYRIAVTVPLSGTPVVPPSGVTTNPFAAYSSDPLTTGAYFLVIGYYVCYYAALLWRARQGAASPGQGDLYG